MHLQGGFVMWQQIFLGFVGLASGLVIAGGLIGLLIGLSIVPRFAGITRTAQHVMLYEDATLLGAVLGNLFFLGQWKLPLGLPFLLVFGAASGIYLGFWVMALAEMANIFPIFARRIKFTQGLPFVILSVGMGKIAGSLLYYWRGLS